MRVSRPDQKGERHDSVTGLAGTPVRRPLTIEALVIVRPGRFAPADVGIFLALRRQYRLVARVRRADAGRLLRCCVRRHAAIIPGAAERCRQLII